MVWRSLGRGGFLKNFFQGGSFYFFWFHNSHSYLYILCSVVVPYNYNSIFFLDSSYILSWLAEFILLNFALSCISCSPLYSLHFQSYNYGGLQLHADFAKDSRLISEIVFTTLIIIQPRKSNNHYCYFFLVLL